MLFTQPVFLFGFLPAALATLELSRRTSKPQVIQLVVFGLSVSFYATWDRRSIPILLGSLFFTYLFARLITRSKSRPTSARRISWLLGIGVWINLVMLLVPKYWDAVAKVLDTLFGIKTFGGFSPWFPVGISFFAFTQIAYLVDLRNEKVKPANFLTLGAFVTFFPHLIAGPILRPAQTIDELQRPRAASSADFQAGLQLLIIGIAKKTLIADPLGTYIQPFFVAIDSGTQFNSSSTWILILCYALQLYFDFSGYSQMALGLALMMGFHVPVNFDSPYRSLSIIDFWKRWHISLSSFLRDYLYIPLGGSRRGKAIRYRNLMITMVLGGMWHGSTLNFALWGLMHGLFLIVAHMIYRTNRHQRTTTRGIVESFISWFGTMIAVLVAWVPFRVASIHATVNTWASMFMQTDGVRISGVTSIALPLAAGIVWIAFEPRTALVAGRKTKKLAPTFHHILLGVLLVIALIAQGSLTEFLYARF